ncbi:hypothetical protein AKJ16_DCAP18876 [Drosera capensis]
MTWGKSKLIPLIIGYLEVIILRATPVPPPTSTSCLRILKGVRPMCLLKGASSLDDLIFELGPAIHVNPVMRQEEERAKGCSIFIPDQVRIE